MVETEKPTAEKAVDVVKFAEDGVEEKQVVKKTLEEMVLANRKRTYKMFANDVDAPLAEDPSLTKMKIKLKIAENYSKFGEVPGILIDKVRRQKILKDLGHATSLESK